MTAQILTMPAARRMIDRAESEKAFQQRVIDLATAYGWLCFHPYSSRKSKEGYPDLTLVRPGESPIWAELKRELGKVSAEQAVWLGQLRQAGARAYVWRPSQWNEIESVLRPHQKRHGRAS